MAKARNVMAVLLGVMFLFALVPVFTTTAQGQTFELRYASPYAPAHFYSIADQKWMAKIEKETNGKVKFKPYWNNTLISGRESMTELANGVADVAFVTPIYEKSGVDLTKAILDFFTDSNPDVNAKIYWELYNKFPEIRKEYDRVKILAVNVGIPMYLMTSKKPVKSIDDMRGMRIRVTGNAMMRTLKTMGAESVGMPVVEMYESLQKGIIQGVIFAHGDYKSLKLSEIVKYETENFVQDRGVYVSRAMNKETWAKLPADVQKVFDANINWWSDVIYQEQKKPEEEGKAMAVKAGVQFVKMDAAGLKKYSDTLDAENLVECKSLDAKGLPATKIYQEARRLVKQYNK
ncbi:MAG TPA: TRAP transporter substrate-binding protein DctP [Syntrophorhabdaceae bacterium]|nr:TRAP transporter substrate-binding protein DctP [Syntrophorhabdaceae bacterium]